MMHFQTAGSSDASRSSFYNSYTSELRTSTGLRSNTTSYQLGSPTERIQHTLDAFLSRVSICFISRRLSRWFLYNLSIFMHTTKLYARGRRRDGCSSRYFSSYQLDASDKENSTGSYAPIVEVTLYTLEAMTVEVTRAEAGAIRRVGVACLQQVNHGQQLYSLEELYHKRNTIKQWYHPII